MMFHSIKAKITTIVISILLCVMTIQLFANFVFAETYYINRKSKTLTSIYKELSTLSLNDLNSIFNVINQYEDTTNIRFFIMDSQHRFIYDSKRPRDSSDDEKTLSYFNSKQDKYTFQPTVHIFKQKNGNDRLSLYGLLGSETNPYYITIYTSVKAMKADMKDTNLFLFYIALTALTGGGILTYFAVGKITKPIEEIDKTAQRVSYLDFSMRATEGLSQDEIGRLAANINHMSDNLEKSIQDLRYANKMLEKENLYKEKINQERKAFVANVSHELKTPLSVLNGYTEILKQDLPGIDKNFYYDVILEETNYMTDLVYQLLSLSKLEQGILTIVLQPMNLTSFLEDLIKRNQILFAQNHLSCHLIKQDYFMVYGHPMYLEQVIQNYISNAIHYGRKNHDITVQIQQRDSVIRVSVINQGKTIPSEDADHIWESFYQVDKSRTRTNENHIGIGLYIVKEIITAFHGTYGFDNLEDGVSFWFELNKADI